MTQSTPAESGHPTPITIITGFLGSGKTTLILNLIPQLPSDYKLALIKNEFGDVAVDSQLASARAISGVRELLNGCICCNLVGSLGDALMTLREEQTPDRIVIETSGSAFPATLAMEVNRLAKETGNYVLDGVVSVIDVENWKGYDDTSVTAKLQAKYTDLLVLNKWEEVGERALEDCVDRILDLDLDIPTPRIQSSKGRVPKDALLGLDARLARETGNANGHADDHAHNHDHDHQSEVEVLSITLPRASQESSQEPGLDLPKFEKLLRSAPKDEVYRIKGIIYSAEVPTSSNGDKACNPGDVALTRYILNWAFGRWTFTAVASNETKDAVETEPIARLTIVTARFEANKWTKKIKGGDFIAMAGSSTTDGLEVVKVA